MKSNQKYNVEVARMTIEGDRLDRLLEDDKFYIVRIDAPPGVEVPGGCYVTVESGPFEGLVAAYTRLTDPKPRAHTLPDIVFLPSTSSVWAFNDVVASKPHLLVSAQDVDNARRQRNMSVTAGGKRQGLHAGKNEGSKVDSIRTPPGKPTLPMRPAGDSTDRRRSLSFEQKEEEMKQSLKQSMKTPGASVDPKVLFGIGSDSIPDELQAHEKRKVVDEGSNGHEDGAWHKKSRALEASAEDAQPNTVQEDGAKEMDSLAALRAAATARIMWMFNPYSYNMMMSQHMGQQPSLQMQQMQQHVQQNMPPGGFTFPTPMHPAANQAVENVTDNQIAQQDEQITAVMKERERERERDEEIKIEDDEPEHGDKMRKSVSSQKDDP
eukprot:jgi/Picsp_1/1997/NSC_05463-R1_---NA---